MKKGAITFLLLGLSISNLLAQNYNTPKKEISNSSELWLGSYTKYRISEKMFYYGEYHYRRRNDFIKNMAQIYLRFGLTYLVNKSFEITGGIVSPIYWAPDQNAVNIDKQVMQYRLWSQFLFVQHLARAKIYHQFRFEQRWKRDYIVNSPYKPTYRFRYKFATYIPLNNHHLISKTLFLSFYEEIFIQAGRSVVYDHMEDNRVFIGLGYIVNESLQFQAGYMWTYRHKGGPYNYEHRHIPRVSLYHTLDFYRKRQQKIKRNIPFLENEF